MKPNPALRLITTAALLACAAACRSGSSPQPEAAQSAGEAADSAKLTTTVGQLSEASDLLAFIAGHQQQPVELDLEFPREDFQGSDTADAAHFTVWEDCDNLQDGQKPGPLAGGCTGFEFVVPHASAQASPLKREGAIWRLRGRFRVEPAGGPLQGLMAVRLVPLTSGQP